MKIKNMETIMETIMDEVLIAAIVLIILISVAYSIFMHFRNKDVLKFREELTKYYSEETSELMHKYAYDDLLHSTKPLKLELWYTEEEVALLKKNKKD